MIRKISTFFFCLLVSGCSGMEASDYGTVVDVAVGSPDHTILVSLVQAAELVDLLSSEGPFTVFAPTNDAFAALGNATLTKYLDPVWNNHLEDILLYHVATGAAVQSADLALAQLIVMANGWSANITSLQPPMINNASIVAPDLVAGNGIVHVIDRVLLPESVIFNIVEGAVSNPDTFSTLVELVGRAGLVETLQGPGPFTVFAPTNDAFEALDDDTVEYLLNNTDVLMDVLLYHVYPGIVVEENAEDGAVLIMANNETTTISISASSTMNSTITEGNTTAINAAEEVLAYFVNDAQVVLGDYLVNNGVIHVIDSVLLPDAAFRKYRKN